MGGALGVGAAYANARIFRSDRSGFAKYILTALISVSAVLVLLAVAVAIEVARS